jgi:enoyl-CoA hydratase/carnithine racemase
MPLVEVEREGAVATLALNDPERRNALSEGMGRELAERVRGLAADPALRAAARALAAEIAACAPAAVRDVRRSLARSENATLDEMVDLEAAEQALSYESRDLLEGLAAAQEGRSPRFSDPG